MGRLPSGLYLAADLTVVSTDSVPGFLRAEHRLDIVCGR